MHFDILIATNNAHKHIPLPTMYTKSVHGDHGETWGRGYGRDATHWQYSIGHEIKNC